MTDPSRRVLLRSGLRDAAARAFYALGLTRAGRARGRLTIATFHRVLPSSQRREYPLPGLAVTPEELDSFCSFFARHYRCGSLAESLRRWQEGGGDDRPLLALTFDDGQLDNYLHARPVLERHGLHATFFVPVAGIGGTRVLWHDRLAFAAAALVRRGAEIEPELAAGLGLATASAADPVAAARGAVDRAKPLPPGERERLVEAAEQAAGPDSVPAWDGLMGWEQVAALRAVGHEIGSHSMSHALLPQCDAVTLEHEVASSRRELEARLDAPVESFCYPNGDCDGASVESVRRAGYRWAVTTRWGSNRRGQDPLRLKRCDLQSDHARTRHGAWSEARLAWRLSGPHPGLSDVG